MVRAGDAVILIEDGVYGSISAQAPSLSSIREQVIERRNDDVTFFALQPDFEARGLDTNALIAHFTLVDDSGFVDLVARADNTLSWY